MYLNRLLTINLLEMKKLIKTTVIATFLFLIIPDNIFAQGPPPWAPAHGYRAKTRHIYFPEQNFYYDIEAHNYIYLNRGQWSISATIPRPFININLGGAPQVQLNFIGHNPYRDNHVHVVKYKKPKKRKVIYYDNHHDHHHHHRGKGHGKH